MKSTVVKINNTRGFAFFCFAVILAGCENADVQPAGDTTAGDTTALAPATPESRAAISLADVAGTWRLRTTDEAGGNAVESELTATPDTSGWTLTRPNGETVPVRVVAVGGDSVVTEAGPYESALRSGIPVHSRMVLRLEEDRLVGTTVARYVTSGGDSVAHRPTEGRRAVGP